jgi:hypothetical protein
MLKILPYVGSSLLMVGAGVGDSVGALVGYDVGLAVGNAVGLAVGVAVGNAVGLAVLEQVSGACTTNEMVVLGALRSAVGHANGLTSGLHTRRSQR